MHREDDYGTILIVDDNLTNLQVLFSTLKQQGYRVIPAQGAESTFLRLKHQIPDLILLDIMMPDIDGFELYQQLRNHSPTADIPVIFISALDDYEAIVRGLKLGAVDYITKPFRAEEVLARVGRQLELNRLQRALKHELESRYALEASLRQAKEQAESASLAKSAFLANMSHELRTPLNAVLGYAQILQYDPNLNETQHQGVLTIRRSGEYLLTLINDILDLAKVEAGHFELSPNCFELKRFFSDLSDLFNTKALEKGLDFCYLAGTGLPAIINVDEKRLRQICMNLLSNAVKFTEHGEVKLATDYRDGILTVSVTDTGIGIAKSVHDRLFKPFMQTGENRYKQQGTGLGLAISRNLVELMGGRIELESEAGKGCCFKLLIPAPIVSTASADQTSEPTESIIGLRRNDGLTGALQVLIVDDIADNRAILRGLLEPLSFLVTEASNGEEAVSLTADQDFDIIFMDLVMPKMDGITTTRKILAQESNTNQLIVSITASAFAEDRTISLEAGCRDHLTKPIERSELLRILRLYLPLEWKYTKTNHETMSTVADTKFNSKQLETLNNMLQRGAIHEIIQYLERMIRSQNCPGQAHRILALIKDFKLREVQRLLELP